MSSRNDLIRDLAPALSEEKRPRSWLRNRQDDARGLSSRYAFTRDLVLLLFPRTGPRSGTKYEVDQRYEV